MKTRIIAGLSLVLLVVAGVSFWFSGQPAAPANPPAATLPTSSEWPPRTATTTPQEALSPQQMLTQSWATYRNVFIQADGRTMDPLRDQATTSEGQSYSLLRAVWMDDRVTFDKVLAWSDSNLRVRGDKLYGYLWGKGADGRWGMLDNSVASDADQDIALALIFAGQRWNDARYSEQALVILNDLWAKTVVQVGNRPYLTAGDWAVSKEKPVLNPSYLAPYAYRIFAQADKSHPWLALVDTSYEVLEACTHFPLDRERSVGLPANWCAIDKTTGQIGAPAPEQQLDTHFGYDAFRTYWRVALDAHWFGERRAYDYLRDSSFLREVWSSEGAVSPIYQHDGAVVRSQEDPTVYGALIANLQITDPAAARQLYTTKLVPLFIQNNEGESFWIDEYNYYAQNWLWFGVALYADQLPNLAS